MSHPNRLSASKPVSRIAIAATLGAGVALTVPGVSDASDLRRETVTQITLDGYCDVVTVTVFPTNEVGENDDSCDGLNGIGSGMEGQITGVHPKDVTIGETYSGDTTSSYLWNIQYPLATGGSWSIYKTSDGVNYSYLNSGTYTIDAASAAPAKKAGLPAHSVDPTHGDRPQPPHDMAETASGTTYIQFDGYCNYIKLTVFPWHQVGDFDDNSCNGTYGVGSGMFGKVVGLEPKGLVVGETDVTDDSTTYLITYEYPLITGRSFSVSISGDGEHYTDYLSGTYTVVGAAEAQRPHGGKSLQSAFGARTRNKDRGTHN